MTDAISATTSFRITSAAVPAAVQMFWCIVNSGTDRPAQKGSEFYGSDLFCATGSRTHIFTPNYW